MDAQVQEREARWHQRGKGLPAAQPEPGSANAAGKYDAVARLFYTTEPGVHPPALSLTSVVAPKDQVLVLVHVDLTPGTRACSVGSKRPLP